MRKYDLEDLAHFAECAGQLTRTVDEVICDGASTAESYSLSLCGVSYLMDFIAAKLGELATEERAKLRSHHALPGNDR